LQLNIIAYVVLWDIWNNMNTFVFNKKTLAYSQTGVASNSGLSKGLESSFQRPRVETRGSIQGVVVKENQEAIGVEPN
jgi:hypothetical protein